MVNCKLLVRSLSLGAVVLVTAPGLVHAQGTAPGTGTTPGSNPNAGTPTTTIDNTTRTSSAWRRDYGRGDGYSLLPYTRRGYFGINLGKGEYDLPCGTGGYDCDDPDASVYLYTGGMFNDFFGAELGYLYGGSADRAGGRTRSHGLRLSAVLRAQFDHFNLFLKGGGIYGQTRVSTGALSDQVAGRSRGWGGSYGGGVGFDFTRNSGIVLEWARNEFRVPGLGRQDFDTTSIGYVYRF